MWYDYIYNDKFFLFFFFSQRQISHTKVAGGGCSLGKKKSNFHERCFLEELISKGKVLYWKSSRDYTYHNRLLWSKKKKKSLLIQNFRHHQVWIPLKGKSSELIYFVGACPCIHFCGLHRSKYERLSSLPFSSHPWNLLCCQL